MKQTQFLKVEKNRLNLNVGIVTFLKMFLRGVTNLSFVIDLYGIMNQKKVGERGAVELPSGDTVIAVKTSPNEAIIISAYNKFKPNEEISSRAEKLINNLFKITLAEKKGSFRITARDISTVGKEVSYA